VLLCRVGARGPAGNVWNRRDVVGPAVALRPAGASGACSLAPDMSVDGDPMRIGRVVALSVLSGLLVFSSPPNGSTNGTNHSEESTTAPGEGLILQASDGERRVRRPPPAVAQPWTRPSSSRWTGGTGARGTSSWATRTSSRKGHCPALPSSLRRNPLRAPRERLRVAGLTRGCCHRGSNHLHSAIYAGKPEEYGH
jgi:hypothetical protein